MTAQPSEREAMDRILEQQACDQSRRLVRSSEREARARSFLCEDVWLSIPAYMHKSIIKASLSFADRERADEREAEKERCAKVADAHNDGMTTTHTKIAAAIRNRKDENDG